MKNEVYDYATGQYMIRHYKWPIKIGRDKADEFCHFALVINIKWINI